MFCHEGLDIPNKVIFINQEVFLSYKKYVTAEIIKKKNQNKPVLAIFLNVGDPQLHLLRCEKMQCKPNLHAKNAMYVQQYPDQGGTKGTEILYMNKYNSIEF